MASVPLKNLKIHYSIAVVAGLIGAGAMSLFIWLLRSWGLTTLNMEVLLGSLLLPDVPEGTWWLGHFWHLLNGVLFACLYTYLFHRKVGQADVKTGLLFGAVHWLAAGLFFGLLPFIHPLIPEMLPAPGIFASSEGILGIAILLATHLIFGATVAWTYNKSLAAISISTEADTEHPEQAA